VLARNNLSTWNSSLRYSSSIEVDLKKWIRRKRSRSEEEEEEEKEEE